MTLSIKETFLPARGICIGFSETLGRFDAALCQVRQWQCRLANGNRWIRARSRLESFIENGESTATQQELERLAFELREIDEFCEIIEACGPNPTSPEAGAIRQILSGTEHPDTEQKSHARDSQYELWLLGYLRAHSIDAWLDEPDLWFTWNRSNYPIAAKRPRSQAGIQNSVRAAIHQLRPHDSWGLVALSMDVVARAPGQMLAAESPKEAAELTDLVFMEILESLISVRSSLSKQMPGSKRGRPRNVAVASFRCAFWHREFRHARRVSERQG